MDSVAAISAAIRERLLSGRPAPLPGLGTLVRQHVASRIEERPDGTRVLLPPGETIGLAPGDDDDSLAAAYGRLRGLDGEEAVDAYAAAMDQLEARLAVMGEVRLPGVGLLRRTSGGVVLGVEADLLAAVNRTYEGLSPIGAPTPEAPAAEPATAPPPPPEPTPAPMPEPEPEVDAVLAPEIASRVPPEIADAVDEPGPPPLDAPEPLPLADLADAPADVTVEPAPDEVVDAPNRALEPESAREPELALSDDEPETDADVVDAGPPGPMPSDDASAPVTESAFVDEHTLDDDLDDLDGVLAVPFGTEASAAEVLPPTPPDHDPALADASVSVPAVEPDGAWDLPADSDEPDADIPTETPAITDVPGEPPVPAAENAVVVERVGPDAELAALLGPADAPTPPTLVVDDPADPALVIAEPSATTAVEPVAEGAPRRRFRWWLLLLVLALLAAAVVWAWPLIMAQLGDRTPPEAVPTTVETSPTAAAAPEGVADAAPDDSATTLASVDTDADLILAEPAAEPEESAAPSAAPSGSAASGILPPRIAGLDAADAQALSGREAVSAETDAWTLVVLSTGSRPAADALAERYRTAGYRVGILEASGSRRWRVGVGAFDSRDHAIRLYDRLPPQAPGDAWPLDLRTL